MSLTSRERILAAIDGEEPDHVPLRPTFIGPWTKIYWRNSLHCMNAMLRLGLDSVVSLGVPRHNLSPEVKVRLWKETPANEKYPVLYKVYETPAGDLRQVVVKTEDWPHGDEVPLYSDFVTAGGRSREFPIERPEDLGKLRYLMSDFSKKQIEKSRRDAQRQRALADKYGVLLDGSGGYGGTSVAQLCGFQRLLRWLVSRPGLVKELLGVIHEFDLKRVRMVLDADVDLVTRDGWYENILFWSIKRYKEFIEPLVREEAELVHRAGKRFRYTITMGLVQLADTLKDMGIDVIYGVDPVVEKESPQEIRRRLGPDICLWGGISEAVTIEQGTGDEIGKATKDVIEAFAPEGLVLSTVGSFLTREAWEKKGPILIEAWRRYGKYPIKDRPLSQRRQFGAKV